MWACACMCVWNWIHKALLTSYRFWSVLLCQRVPIITHYTHFWPSTGSRSTVWRALGGGKNVLIGVRSLSFCKFHLWPWKFYSQVVTRWDHPQKPPSVLFYHQGVSTFTQVISLHLASRKGIFPLSAVLTAPHASPLHTPHPSLPMSISKGLQCCQLLSPGAWLHPQLSFGSSVLETRLTGDVSPHGLPQSHITLQG